MLKILTSWDDGTIEDEQTLRLLEYYDVCGIFFIPNVCEWSNEFIREVSKKFEIGGHTVSHPEDLKRLSPENQKIEIEENKEWLEEVIGKRIRWFAYPSGRYKPDTTCPIVQRAGYKFARTTVVGSIEMPKVFDFRVNTTAQIGNNTRKEYENWFEYVKSLMNILDGEDRLIHIWGHSKDLNSESAKEFIDLLELIKKNKIQNYL